MKPGRSAAGAFVCTGRVITSPGLENPTRGVIKGPYESSHCHVDSHSALPVMENPRAMLCTPQLRRGQLPVHLVQLMVQTISSRPTGHRKYLLCKPRRAIHPWESHRTLRHHQVVSPLNRPQKSQQYVPRSFRHLILRQYTASVSF